MVVADLAGFERLVRADTDGGAPLVDGARLVVMPPAAVAAAGADWAAAVAAFFRTPPPRLIAVYGGGRGGYGIVAGATPLRVIVDVTAAGPHGRLDVFRYEPDRPPVAAPPGTAWTPAAVEALPRSLVGARFECFWCSGHIAFRSPGTALAALAPVCFANAAAGLPPTGPGALCTLRVVNAGGATTAETVPVGVDTARTSGRLVVAAAFGAGAEVPLSVLGCNGDTVVALGQGWHRAMYGWLLQRSDTGTFAAFTGSDLVGARSLGCFLDRDGPGERALDRLYGEDVRGNDAFDRCRRWAADQGRTVFALEAGSQCYVRGDDDPRAAQRWGRSDRCDHSGSTAGAFTGLSHGGDWGLALYQLPPPKR